MIKLAELSQKFKEDGMLAYVALIQRKEKEIGCDVLTHQKWFAILIYRFASELTAFFLS